MTNLDTKAGQQPEIDADPHSDNARMSSDNSTSQLTIGWREWVSLPELGLPAIKAKVDTGARTSAIHASDIERFQHDDGSAWVAFTVMPIQRISSISRRCKARLVDIRKVTDSGGHSEERFFITTDLVIGDQTRSVEITLAQRSDMLFRMLLGRTSMVPGIVVNPQLSYTLGRLKARSIYRKDAVGANR